MTTYKLFTCVTQLIRVCNQLLGRWFGHYDMVDNDREIEDMRTESV